MLHRSAFLEAEVKSVFVKRQFVVDLLGIYWDLSDSQLEEHPGVWQTYCISISKLEFSFTSAKIGSS